MSVTSHIPDSIQDVLKVIFKHNFAPLTLKQIGEELKLDVNTTTQRILRNPDFFKIVQQKPKTLVANPQADVVYYFHNHQCASCFQQFPAEQLHIIYIDESLPAKNTFANMLPRCDTCQENHRPPMFVRERDERVSEKQSSQKGKAQWEYLVVNIRETNESVMPSENPIYAQRMRKFGFKEEGRRYYEYTSGTESVWKHIVNDSGEIISRSLQDILNHFGSTGWELVPSVNWLNEETDEDEELEELRCVFKRRSGGT